MARRVRVASRAVRRGRRLRARPSEIPPAPEATESAEQANASEDASEAAQDELREERVEVPPPTPSTQRLTGQMEAAAAKVDATELEAAESSALDDDDDDIDAALSGDGSVPPARVSSYSRPPAPVMDWGDDSEVAPDPSAPDPNATTLVSSRGPSPSRPPTSRVDVVVAKDDETEHETAPESPGFIPEEDEPPLSAEPSNKIEAEDVAPPSSEATSDSVIELPLSKPTALDTDFFRKQESSLAPVVDDKAPQSEEVTPEAAFMTAELSRRRRRLRRGVGMAVVAIGLLTVGLVVLGNNDTVEPDTAKATVAAKAAKVAKDTKKSTEEANEAGQPLAASQPLAAATLATVEEPEYAAGPPAADYKALTKQTVDLLTNRKFTEAIPYAQKMIETRPESAMGYRCLGAAYQDLGRYADAQKSYSDCATNASKGEVHECSALGGANMKVLKKQKERQAPKK